MMKKIAPLAFMLLFNTVHAAETADPYPYRDESTIRDRRNIAVLAYGSLVNDPAPTDGRPALQVDTAFGATNISLPVAFTRQSSKGTDNRRITAVIDNTFGTDKRVYAARSSFRFLPNARNNLAGREGVPFNARENKYNLDNIFYMKKGLPVNGQLDSNEKIVAGTRDWIIRTSDSRVELPSAKATAFANWADQNGYTAIIWASFPPTYTSVSAVARDLQNDSTLMRNTQNYVRILPDGAQTSFEQAVVRGNVSGFIR